MVYVSTHKYGLDKVIITMNGVLHKLFERGSGTCRYPRRPYGERTEIEPGMLGVGAAFRPSAGAAKIDARMLWQDNA